MSDYYNEPVQLDSAQIVSIDSPAYPRPQESAQPQGQQQHYDPGQQPQQQFQFTPQQLQQLQQQQQPQQPQFQAPQLDDAGKAWWGQFQQYTGLNQEQFLQGVQQLQQLPQLQQLVAAQQRDAQMATLRQEWGTSFDEVMPLVAQRFAALPAQMQAGLDNIDGARLLYAQVMQERASLAPQVPGAQPPRYDRPTSVQQNQRSQEPQFTQAQINSMSEADYIKNQAAIEYAYRNGLVR